MAAVVDNDVALKAAQYGLIVALGAQLSAAHGSIITLDQAPYVLGIKKPRPKIQFADAQKKSELAAFLASSSHLSNEPVDLAVLAALGRCPNIDSGEALIFAVAHQNSAIQVCTGDKRALVALASEPSLAVIAQGLAGRCTHLEQCIRDLSQHTGYNVLRDAVVAGPTIDRSLAGIFREGKATKQADASKRLKKSIDRLRAATGTLLAP